MALVEQAGWNQTPADWRRFLSASADGCFAAVVDGAVVGTSATIGYGGAVAWIGMVIVDARHRGKGIGRQLLQRACAAVDAAGIPCAKLDATPAGEPLYMRHGFVRERSLERWEWHRVGACPSPSPSLPVFRSSLSEDAFALDRSVFGVDRRAVLRSLHEEWAEAAMEVRTGSGLRGYSLGRRGLVADQGLGFLQRRMFENALRLFRGLRQLQPGVQSFPLVRQENP